MLQESNSWRTVHIVADFLIGLAYYFMPVMLYIKSRKQVKVNKESHLFLMFAVFMVGGGTNFMIHAYELMRKGSIYHAAVINTAVAIGGAVICWATAIVLVPTIAEFYSSVTTATLELQDALARELAAQNSPSILRIRGIVARLEVLALKGRTNRPGGGKE